MNADQLYKNCTGKVSQYPAGMRDLEWSGPFPGRGFFPVASGSFHAAGVAGDVRRKYLVLGQDWGAEAALNDLKKDADADMFSPTAKNLVDLLERAGIPLEACFFSNALMGVRCGKRSEGESPGWKDKNFVKECAAALKEQIKGVQPEAIICLGRAAPSLLKWLFPACTIWEKAGSFKEIDAKNLAVIKLTEPMFPVDRAGILLHPSMRPGFRKRLIPKRHFKEAKGEAAEVAILQALV